MTRLVPLAMLLALAGCESEMAEQPRYHPYEAADWLPGGGAALPPVPGTVGRGDLERQAALRQPPPDDPALLDRGAERYAIFCAPCHGPKGRGDGPVVGLYVPVPPRLGGADLSAADIVRVITEGSGRMYSYASRVPPADRWAIAAYVRTLPAGTTGAR